MSFIKIKSLSKSYGNNKILNDINLEVSSGEFLSLLGPSGCGKTTLLRCLAGLEPLDSANSDILLEGNSIRSLRPENRRFGMVFQNYALWPNMTVEENISFPLRIQHRAGKLSKAQVRTELNRALELVRLEPLRTRLPQQLSGGQQQRVALARAIAMSPQLLLLDEPLSSLDALLREDLAGEIRQLQRKLKLTTILVTHDRKEALGLSDRIVILHEGCIKADGKPEELFLNPPNDFTAEFLSGGQTLRISGGEAKCFIPRRWRKSSNGEYSGKVVSRLYLGDQYEYWVAMENFSDPVKFFAQEPIELNSKICLSYDAGQSSMIEVTS